MTSHPPPPIPKLPSRRVSALLATAVLGVGIALGALIGPGPAASLASSSRASALARVLALVALGSGASASSEMALSSNSPPATSPQPTPSTTSEASAGGAAGGGAASAATPASGVSNSLSSTPKTSPTSSTTPAESEEGEGEGEGEKKHKPLPPIASVWLIELPYGTSIENALKQSAAAPYIDGQLKGQGTVLSGYSPLAAAQLAGDAALLSGQVDAGVTTLTPPPCGTSTSSPCPSGEPAGLQAANAFLQEAVPKIVASTAYQEHGLIVITFGATTQQGTQPTGTAPTTTGASTPAAGTGAEAGASVAYPTGSLTSTLTASGVPAGALLLSPFLSHAGGQVADAFNPLAPHASLEGLFRSKTAG